MLVLAYILIIKSIHKETDRNTNTEGAFLQILSGKNIECLESHEENICAPNKNKETYTYNQKENFRRHTMRKEGLKNQTLTVREIRKTTNG